MPSKARKVEVVLVRSEKNDFWFTRGLLLIHLKKRTNDQVSEKFAFAPYFWVNSHIDSVIRILNRHFPVWAIEDKVNHGRFQCGSGPD